MLKGLVTTSVSAYSKCSKFMENYLSILWDLSIRVYVFCAFFSSGWLKFMNALNGHWEMTVYLFQYEHPVPFLPAEIAAIFGTFNEVFFSVLLLIGLGSRLSALVLLLMTAIIEFTYTSSVYHLLWAFLLFSVLIKGPGKASCDHFIAKYLYKQYVLR